MARLIIDCHAALILLPILFLEEVVEKDHISPSDSSSKYTSFQSTQESESVCGEHIFSLLHEGGMCPSFSGVVSMGKGWRTLFPSCGRTYHYFYLPNSDHRFECQLDSFYYQQSSLDGRKGNVPRVYRIRLKPKTVTEPI